MKFIDNRGITDPSVNLAIEEYALTHLPAEDDYLLFYINEPSIIIGRNQNTFEEINLDYVESHGIRVVRRLSGGGAVYHDLGNLNFSFITKDDGQSFHNYKKFTDPVVRALRSLGVEAELSGRNDIQVGERKISGNAQFAAKGRMFSHGTLLFDSQIDHVVDALKVNAAKIESKGIKSIRSRVANIREFLERPMAIEQFREYLLKTLFGDGGVHAYPLTEKDWEGIGEISRARYRNWDWNFGKSPRSNFKRSRRFEGVGTLDVRMELDKGIIRAVKFYGDFFGTGDVRELERLLTGLPFQKQTIEDKLGSVELRRYFGGIEREQFFGFLFS